MASKIIKQGAERAFEIRQFSFADDRRTAIPSCERVPYFEVAAQPGTKFESPKVEAPNAGELDREQLEREAYERGFRQGETTGKESAAKQIEAAMKRYADSIAGVSGMKSLLYAQAEHEVVKLAVEVAKKIVHREIQVDRNIVQTLVRVALSHITDKKSVTLRLSPADYKYVQERQKELVIGDGWDITLQSDNSIEQGGCLVETACGDVDARIEEKFREVEQTFFEDLK